VTYRFLPQARVDFDLAVDWYEAQQPGLGDDFLNEVYATVQRIVANPHAFARVARVPAEREVRILTVHRFEYLVIYEVLPSEVVILGILHARRGRQPWRSRL
jgi:toxin ParE1/3/4